MSRPRQADEDIALSGERCENPKLVFELYTYGLAGMKALAWVSGMLPAHECMKQYAITFSKGQAGQNYLPLRIQASGNWTRRTGCCDPARRSRPRRPVGNWTCTPAERVGAGGRCSGHRPVHEDQVITEQVTLSCRRIFAHARVSRAPQNWRLRLVMSDMARKTTGSKLTDQARSIQLVEAAFGVGREWLAAADVHRKVFEGPEVHPSCSPCAAARKVSCSSPEQRSRAWKSSFWGAGRAIAGREEIAI